MEKYFSNRIKNVLEKKELADTFDPDLITVKQYDETHKTCEYHDKKNDIKIRINDFVTFRLGDCDTCYSEGGTIKGTSFYDELF